MRRTTTPPQVYEFTTAEGQVMYEVDHPTYGRYYTPAMNADEAPHLLDVITPAYHHELAAIRADFQAWQRGR